MSSQLSGSDVGGQPEDAGKISIEASTSLKLHYELKGALDTLLAGQQEILKVLSASQFAVDSSPLATKSLRVIQEEPLHDRGLKDHGSEALDELVPKSDQVLSPRQAASSASVTGGQRHRSVSISSCRSADSDDGPAEETSEDDSPPDSGGGTFMTEAATTTLGQGESFKSRRSRIAVSLAPNWPASIRRRQVFSVAEDFVIDTFSHNMPGSEKWTYEKLASNLALQTPTKSKWRTLHPGGNTRFIMDLLGLATLFFDLWVVPFILAWDVTDDWTRDCSFLSICYWCMDLALNFVTGYHRYGEVEMRLRYIVKHYLSTMFVIDLSILVVDVLATIADVREGRLLRAAKVGKLVRMFRLARLINVVERVEHLTTYALPVEIQAFLQILELLLLIVWVNHLLCCCWWAIGTHGHSDTGMSWISTLASSKVLGGQAEQSGGGVDNSLYPETYADTSRLYQYTTSLHWSIVQMTPGSMEVQPLNSLERGFNILCLIFGIIFFSSLISSLSAVTTHMRILKSEQVLKLKCLRKFLNQRKVDRRTQLSIMKQVASRFRSQRPLVQQDVPALELLSDTLRRELHFEILLPHIMKHGFFHLVIVMNSHTAMSLCSEAMDLLIRAENDTLFLPDFAATGAYFVTQGTLRYRQYPGTSRVERETRQEVEAEVCLAEAALWSHWKHVGHCDTLTMCEVINVSTKRLGQVVHSHYALRHIAAEYCKVFHTILKSAFPPHHPWPSDLQVAFTSFREIVMASSREVRIAIGRLSIEMVSSNFMWQWRLSRPTVEKLAKQIDAGSCVLVPCNTDLRRRVERLMAVTMLEMNQDGLVLVELGRMEEDSNENLMDYKCQYPSIVQTVGEMPSDALTRLIQGRLSAMGRHLRIQSSRQDVEHTDHQRLRTRYTRTVYTVTLEVPFEEIAFVSDSEKMTKTDAFLVSDEGESVTILCAWKEPEVVQRLQLQTAAASAELKALADAALETARLLSTVTAI